MPIPRHDTTDMWVVFVALLCLLVAEPSRAFDFDIPKPSGFIVDEVGVLNAGTKQKLVDLNRELQQKTGAEIAVVVVPTTTPEPIFDYAMAVAESWKPGSAEKDNGVVFVAAIEDRKMQILTGYGAEGALPDGLVGEIRDRIVVPAFRQGDYGRGILEASQTMAALLAKDAGVTLTGVPAPKSMPRRRAGRGGLSSLILLLLLFLFLRSLSGRGPRGRGGSGRDALTGFVLGNVLGRSFPRHHGGFGGGGFGGGGFGGGGFGGFGGGGFGGGGAGGSW